MAANRVHAAIPESYLGTRLGPVTATGGHRVSRPDPDRPPAHCSDMTRSRPAADALKLPSRASLSRVGAPDRGRRIWGVCDTGAWGPVRSRHSADSVGQARPGRTRARGVGPISGTARKVALSRKLRRPSILNHDPCAWIMPQNNPRLCAEPITSGSAGIRLSRQAETGMRNPPGFTGSHDGGNHDGQSVADAR